MRTNLKSKKLCSASAELIGGNDFFLGLILVRVPVRSVVRFKSVSKQWCALISDPQFGRRHTLENPSSRIPLGLHLYNPADSMEDTVYSISRSNSEGKIPLCLDPAVLTESIPINYWRDLLSRETVMRMIQSCNGLNLFRFNSFERDRKAYYVRNLVTNEIKSVPSPKLDSRFYEWIVTFVLAFDPLVSPHYKVICATASIARVVTSKFMIFSSETGRWKDTNVTMDGHELQYGKGLYCHGAIYWIVINTQSCYRFDIEAKNLTKISFPPKASGSGFRHFVESNGHLYIVCVVDCAQKNLNVYELDEVTMKWVIKHRVHINHLISSLPHDFGNGGNLQKCHSIHSILSVLRGEGEEDTALLVNISGKVVLYNLQSKKVEVLLSELRWNSIKGGAILYLGEPPFIPAYPFVATLHPME
ncbi:F-box protein At5g07610-like [Apium graveolens]|uniref:F-box protein At5g07610-like n=2 Tax=Apium graveolens TaxID=4045 RepID=UPI003D7BF50A